MKINWVSTIFMVGILLFIAGCGIEPFNEHPATTAYTPVAIPETATSIALTLSATHSELTPTQVLSKIRDLYISNGGCELPCLWGIIPGVSNRQDMQNGFSQIGSFRDTTRSVDKYQIITFSIAPPNDLLNVYDDDTWSFHLRLESNVVIGILTGVTVVKEYSTPSLSGFLSRFGAPEEIRVRIIESQLINENPDYEIVLFYPSKGIFISWRGNTKSVISKTEKDISVMACVQYMPTQADSIVGMNSPFFYLFSSEKTATFNEIINIHLSKEFEPTYQSLDSNRINNFYTMYLNPMQEECFPFTYTFWP